jgi:hypothetical protein
LYPILNPTVTSVCSIFLATGEQVVEVVIILTILAAFWVAFPKGKLRIAVLGVVVILVLAGIAPPVGNLRDTPEDIQQVHLMRLGAGLWKYAKEHGGKFPERLSDIPQPYPMPYDGSSHVDRVAASVTGDMRRFDDPSLFGKSSDWLYFPGYTFDRNHDWNSGYANLNEELIIAAAPRALGWWAKGRIVLFSDGSVGRIRETRFQERMQKQLGHTVP